MALQQVRSVRRDWIYGVLNATQRFACATHAGDFLSDLSYIDTFGGELPRARSTVEQFLLEKTLVGVAMRWTTELHAVYRLAPSCGCDAAAMRDLTHGFGREGADVREPFSGWARNHVGEVVRRHPELIARRLAARMDGSNGLERCDIGDLAHANLTAKQVRAAFMMEFNLSPRDYRTRLRVRHALTLLTTTSEKVEAVARDAGFPGKRHFYSALRRFTGLTPGAIRQRGHASVADARAV